MVNDDTFKYETTEDLIETFLDPEKRARLYLNAYKVETHELEKTLSKVQKEAKEALAEAKDKAEKELLKERRRVELSIILMLRQGAKLSTLAILFELSNEEVLAIQVKYNFPDAGVEFLNALMN